MEIAQSRRQFLTTLSLAAAARLVGVPDALGAETPPEMTKLRLLNFEGAQVGGAPTLFESLPLAARPRRR